MLSDSWVTHNSATGDGGGIVARSGTGSGLAFDGNEAGRAAAGCWSPTT